MQPDLTLLTTIARRIMVGSYDPIHDVEHAERVAASSRHFAERLGIDPERQMAVALAGWWHDTARTITKHPSFLWMPFLDDIISSVMLRWHLRRLRIDHRIPRLAARIILCKSLGTGALLTRLLMPRYDRILVSILKDADALDVLNQTRIVKLLPLVASSRVYHFGYKTVMRWFVTSEQLHMKTIPARVTAEDRLLLFLKWCQEPTILAWHTEQFGEVWVETMITRGQTLLANLKSMNSQAAFTSMA